MFSVTRFQSVLQQIPWGTFDEAVRQHASDRYSKGFSSQQHLKAMLFAQLSGASSLRDVQLGYEVQERSHYHLQLPAIRRSTLADANIKRSAQPFAAVADALMHAAGRAIRRERQLMLFLLDSTTIRLVGRGFEWAPRARTPGVKLHIVFASQEALPVHQSITPVTVNDLEEGRKLPIEAGATYVFDKAYCDYAWWHRMHLKGARFVTRAKTGMALERVRSQAVDANQNVILSDTIERFRHRSNRGGHRNAYDGLVRRVQVQRDDDAPLWLLTNDLSSPPSEIAELYKQRWQIELLFKWIKQHLQVKRFLGRSENAVRIQLLVALITYLLILQYRRSHHPRTSVWHVLIALRHGLFQPIQQPESDFQRRRRQAARFQQLQPSLAL